MGTEQQPKLGRQNNSRQHFLTQQRKRRKEIQGWLASRVRCSRLLGSGSTARGTPTYESKDGVTFLRGQQQENTSVMQTLTEEELRNVEKAAEKMNDRED